MGEQSFIKKISFTIRINPLTHTSRTKERIQYSSYDIISIFFDFVVELSHTFPRILLKSFTTTMFGKLCFVLAISCSSARTVNLSDSKDNVREAKAYTGDSKISFLSDLTQVYRVYEECNAKELTPCLKMKFITAMDRLSRKVELPITDYLSLVKEDKAETTNEMDNEVLEATLPRSLEEKEKRLDEIIADKIFNFLASRSFQFKLSGIKDIQRSLQEGKSSFLLVEKNKYHFEERNTIHSGYSRTNIH